MKHSNMAFLDNQVPACLTGNVRRLFLTKGAYQLALFLLELYRIHNTIFHLVQAVIVSTSHYSWHTVLFHTHFIRFCCLSSNFDHPSLLWRIQRARIICVLQVYCLHGWQMTPCKIRVRHEITHGYAITVREPPLVKRLRKTRPTRRNIYITHVLEMITWNKRSSVFFFQIIKSIYSTNLFVFIASKRQNRFPRTVVLYFTCFNHGRHFPL